MLCQNCGKEQANVKYTQIINGVKKQMWLCDKCSKELGVEDINFNMPISFSNFLDDMFGTYSDSLLESIANTKTLSCNKCGMSYNDFFNDGNFGCEECYDIFSNRIDQILKNIHGANTHVGRLGKVARIENKNDKDSKNATQTQEQQKKLNKTEKELNEASKIEELKERLKIEIREERYEDAAKTRDEIKKLEDNK